MSEHTHPFVPMLVIGGEVPSFADIYGRALKVSDDKTKCTCGKQFCVTTGTRYARLCDAVEAIRRRALEKRDLRSAFIVFNLDTGDVTSVKIEIADVRADVAGGAS